jgi:hypothetical protein
MSRHSLVGAEEFMKPLGVIHLTVTFKSYIDLCRRKTRDCAVGMATGYGLDDQRVGVRVSVGARTFTSPCRPDRL